ncbi:hypothetical protein NGRA_1785 [Nosema granulosis]|uniref:Uncharacterized protein n=1 Tax=Nosema granulosis TaxID=83296 RepID=A0A9P6KYU0_9MICR|nr:hypothetical protein NGRA_1785 [Nosema granulosis]
MELRILICLILQNTQILCVGNNEKKEDLDLIEKKYLGPKAEQLQFTKHVDQKDVYKKGKVSIFGKCVECFFISKALLLLIVFLVGMLVGYFIFIIMATYQHEDTISWKAIWKTIKGE